MMESDFELCEPAENLYNVYRKRSTGNLYRVLKLLPGKGRTGDWEPYVEYCALRGVEEESYVRPRTQFLEHFEPVSPPEQGAPPDVSLHESL